LAAEYGLDIKTIKKHLDKAEPRKNNPKPREIMLVMDTTYFKKTFGVMVFRDVYEKENLLWKFVNYETIALYQRGVSELEDRGFKVLGITVDGRRGIFKAFGDIPVQMCQFHQKQIIKRYLSLNPVLKAGIELKELADILTMTDEPSFEHWLGQWFLKWRDFLNEKTENPFTGKRQFTHRRLRSAYNSLKSNLPHLFTYQKYFKEGMPNTTNSLDGTFSHVKAKVNIHRGLKLHRKTKLIQELLRRK